MSFQPLPLNDNKNGVVIDGGNRTEDLLNQLIQQQQITNLYLSNMVGEVFTTKDIEE